MNVSLLQSKNYKQELQNPTTEVFVRYEYPKFLAMYGYFITTTPIIDILY